MRGRPPKPTELKLLQGNPGHRQIDAADEPQPRAGIPIPPPHLNKEARLQWFRWCDELKHMRVITMAERETLAIMCDTWARYLKAEAAIENHGLLIKSPKGYPIQNPALSIRNQAAKELLRFAIEFGLTPAARTRVKTVDPSQYNLPGINVSPGASAPIDPLARVRGLARA